MGVVGQGFRQFRFTVGAPDAEAKFYAAQRQAVLQDSNARNYPSLFVRPSFSYIWMILRRGVIGISWFSREELALCT